MSAGLIALLAVLTYASRALALVLMPHPPERIRVVLDRIPAPLFASLAALSLLEDGAIAGATTLAAAAGALLATPTRSLLWVLTGGLGGYVAGVILIA
jgi:branched-subunit amino acid transport protein